MEIFYSAWQIVVNFIYADAKVPRPEYLPRGSHRMVAKILEDRRDFPILEVIQSLIPIAQPELLSTNSIQVHTDILQIKDNINNNIIAPNPLLIG